MKKYSNIVTINGKDYSNIVEAKNYKDALEIQKKRKAKSKNTFKQHLTLS